jgi:hypothetical protein
MPFLYLTRLLHASYTPLTRLLHASYTPGVGWLVVGCSLVLLLHALFACSLVLVLEAL